jgi:hypothetical protein
MQIKTILSLTFASMAVAAPTVTGTMAPLDLVSVTDTFNAIQAGIDKMVANVKAYTGGSAQVAAIQSDSDNVLKIIRDGTDKVAKSPAMGIADAIGILGPVGTLSSKVDEIINALASKKEVLTKNNLASVVLKDLQDQKNAAEKLVTAILNNLPLPSLLGAIAAPIAKQITDKLDAGAKSWAS